MSIDPVTAILDIGSKVIDRLWPDPLQAAQAKLELFKLQQSGELQQITGQLEINKAEAQSDNWFTSSWRPAIGWVCGLALFFQYIARPLIMWGCVLSNTTMPTLPGIDDNLWQLLLGMLGLGGLRTYEKVAGVTK